MLTIALQLLAAFLSVVVVGGALVAIHDGLERAQRRPTRSPWPRVAPRPDPRGAPVLVAARRPASPGGPWGALRTQARFHD